MGVMKFIRRTPYTSQPIRKYDTPPINVPRKIFMVNDFELMLQVMKYFAF